MFQVANENHAGKQRKTGMKRQTKSVWRFIVRYKREHGIVPTQREIMSGLGLATMTVRRHLALLEQDGIIERIPNQARSMRVLRQPLDVHLPRYHVMVHTSDGYQRLDEEPDGLEYWDAVRLLNDSVPHYTQRQDILYATAGDETITVRRLDPIERQLVEVAALYLADVQ